MYKFALALALILAAPASATWRQNATTVTWFGQLPTAKASKLRDALLWHYEGTALDGALATAARPQIALTDLGGGNSELSITMARAAGDAWVTAYAARACPSESTQAGRAACVNAAIESDLRRLWSAYDGHLKAQERPDDPAPEIP